MISPHTPPGTIVALNYDPPKEHIVSRFSHTAFKRGEPLVLVRIVEYPSLGFRFAAEVAEFPGVGIDIARLDKLILPECLTEALNRAPLRMNQKIMDEALEALRQHVE